MKNKWKLKEILMQYVWLSMFLYISSIEILFSDNISLLKIQILLLLQRNDERKIKFWMLIKNNPKILIDLI